MQPDTLWMPRKNFYWYGKQAAWYHSAGYAFLLLIWNPCISIFHTYHYKCSGCRSFLFPCFSWQRKNNGDSLFHQVLCWLIFWIHLTYNHLLSTRYQGIFPFEFYIIFPCTCLAYFSWVIYCFYNTIIRWGHNLKLCKCCY